MAWMDRDMRGQRARPLRVEEGTLSRQFRLRGVLRQDGARDALRGGCRAGWSVSEFMDGIDGCIRWYNGERIRRSLGGKSPIRYRGEGMERVRFFGHQVKSERCSR